MLVRGLSIAAILLPALAGCDFPANDPNVQIEVLPPAARDGPRLRLSPQPDNAVSTALCGPGAEIRETYPCAGPCLQTPGLPTPGNCIRSMRTCYRSRPAPPCPEPPAAPAVATPKKGG